MKVLRILTALVLFSGTALTARATYLRAKADLAGILIRWAWRQSLHSSEPRPPWPWADTHPVARLQIPRLNFDEIVLDAANPRTLAFGPALLLGGAAPGRPGNIVLAGHRTSWFLPLQHVAVGDQIQLTWFDSRRAAPYQRTYRVDFVQIVTPQDVTLLFPTAQDALTLVTCYPFGSSPHSPLRFAVRAVPLGPAYPSDSAAASH